MVVALAFLAGRFLYRIVEFLRHWYVRSTRIAWRFVKGLVRQIDYRFALVVTLKNLFQPLYGDYSFLGYMFGFIFRFGRVLIASTVYASIILASGALYLAWLAVPPALIIVMFRGYVLLK